MTTDGSQMNFAPLAISGRGRVDADLVVSELAAAASDFGVQPTYTLHTLRSLAAQAEAMLRKKGVPPFLWHETQITHIAQHEPVSPRGFAGVAPILRVRLARKKQTWFLIGIDAVQRFNSAPAVTRYLLPQSAIEYIMSAALSGIDATGFDNHKSKSDLGQYLVRISQIVLPQDPSAHERLSAIATVDALIAGGYASKTGISS